MADSALLVLSWSLCLSAGVTRGITLLVIAKGLTERLRLRRLTASQTAGGVVSAILAIYYSNCGP
jgi:hypothetical protein